MSESDGEQAARSLALELAYVHEVYEQCADRIVRGKLWPKVCDFLRELEPGALHCDVGSGDGKYLKVNPHIYSVGVDRCASFCSIARSDANEVMICDNLYLPYKDDSYDGITSVGVVHHFSSTERRIKALREIARVLKIGGKVMITVWAMEQKNRKFESQDVLVPWPKAYCISSSGMKPRGMSYDERSSRSKHAGGVPGYLLNGQQQQQQMKSSAGSNLNGKSGKSYWIDPTFSPSPSTSSLSSPNETCYSFFRRALQKLAGGRRNSRAWFLENWQNGKDHRYGGDEDEDDDGDVDNLPIELRRLEDPSSLPAALSSGSHRKTNQEGGSSSSSSSSNEATQARRQQLKEQRSSDSLSVKSKSLSSILDVQRMDLVRSRSSIPGFLNDSIDEQERQQRANVVAVVTVVTGVSGRSSPAVLSLTSNKPRLVKQKTHCTEDDDDLGSLPRDDAVTAIQQRNSTAEGDPTESLQSSSPSSKRGNVVHKQSSMNEEFLSIERLKERESVRRNIMKQASLNEEFLYKSKPAFEAFRDSFYSGGSASKRFQLLKDSLASRIKQSTTSIEKVSGEVFKNGISIIMQTLKPTESQSTATTSTATTSSNGSDSSKNQYGEFFKRDGSQSMDGTERRLSREDGSDSSKDSSLQSDTSVESDESFASVIYVGKKNSSPMIEPVVAPTSPTSIFYHRQQPQRQQLNTTSAPPSPRVKCAPDLMSSGRIKAIGVSPLSKQFPATSKSLPPPSPPGLSPKTLNQANMKPFFSGNEVMPPGSDAGSGTSLTERIAEVRRTFSIQPLPTIPNSSTSGDESITKDTVVTAASTTSSCVTTTAAAAAVAAAATDVTITAAASATATNTQSVKATLQPRRPSDEHLPEPRRPSLKTMHDYKSMSGTIDSDDDDRAIEEETSLHSNDAIDEACERLSEKPLTSTTHHVKPTTKTTPKKTRNATDEEDSRASKLNQIKEFLSQKPGFATRTRPAFPIVRRASTTATSGRLENVTKILPRLLSLELFNPETDDLDSDSSDVSSPESGGSVISVISDERYISKKESQDGATNNKSDENSSGDATDSSKGMASASCSTKPDELSTGDAEVSQKSSKSSTSDSDSFTKLSTGSTQSLKQVESSSNVASSLEDAVNNLIKQKEAAKIALPKSKTVTRPTASDTRISPIESTWNEECNRHLIDLTDRLSGTLKNESDQFSTRYTCKYDSGLKQQQPIQTRPARDNDYCDLDNNNQRSNEDEIQRQHQQQQTTSIIERSCSEDSDAGSSSTGSFVVITNSGDFLSERELRKSSSGKTLTQQQQKQHRFNNSMESSDIGDSIENTISESSQAESPNTRRFCSGSTASLASSSLATDHGQRVRLGAQSRSASEEIPSRNVLLRHSTAAAARRSATSTSNGTLSGSSSQESLPSDHMTHHQYYHVFREGELDELINRYVENLHIISSYYDHASWCIVAEKVQVWTI